MQGRFLQDVLMCENERRTFGATYGLKDFRNDLNGIWLLDKLYDAMIEGGDRIE